MDIDFLKWAKSRKLPAALQSRGAWAELFEYHRSHEPHIHQIEPTNHCPYSCIMCPRHDHMKRKKGFMQLDVFKKIVDEIATYDSSVKKKEIELFHFGESLLHRDLPKMVSYTTCNGLRPTLSINPCSLNSSLIDELVAAQPYRVIVSLDSMESQKLKKIRGKYADVHKAIENTRKLIELAGVETKIVVRMIVMHDNNTETELFTEYWNSAGAEVELRDFFPWNDPNLAELGVIEKYPDYMPCPFPWQYLVVQWNGDVVACCRDYNGELRLGNVMQNSLVEIWNGAESMALRKAIASGKGLSQQCEDCLKMYYSEPSN